MKDHWVIRYDMMCDGELETTWEGHIDLYSAIKQLIELETTGFARYVSLQYDPDPEEYEE
jgi:hypothetical protein|tara:strand:- start:240 stop:419 length:180 start_codon:yes stop_codon:yes gene_type:complete